MKSKNSNQKHNRKIQVWVTESIKEQMEFHSATHCFNWSRYLRTQIEARLKGGENQNRSGVL